MAFPQAVIPAQPANRMGIVSGVGEIITIGKHYTPSASGVQRFCQGSFNEQSSPAQRSVVSDSANDADPAGSGAQRVMINYLDGNFQKKQDFVLLNGITPVNTNATDIMLIQEFAVDKSGNNPMAADGTITLKSQTGGAGDDILQIFPGEPWMQCMHLYAPAGKRLVVFHFLFMSPNPDFEDVFHFHLEFDPIGNPGKTIRVFQAPDMRNLPSDFDLPVEPQGKFELFVDVKAASVGKKFASLVRGFLIDPPAQS